SAKICSIELRYRSWPGPRRRPMTAARSPVLNISHSPTFAIAASSTCSRIYLYEPTATLCNAAFRQPSRHRAIGGERFRDRRLKRSVGCPAIGVSVLGGGLVLLHHDGCDPAARDDRNAVVFDPGSRCRSCLCCSAWCSACPCG